MPRYFFNIHHLDPSHDGTDDLGEELEDDQAAWKEATLVASEMFRDIDGKFQPSQRWSLEVADSAGKPLYYIRIIGEQVK
jgi:hypothetical protein